MFLTCAGQEEQFIGFIQAWHINRTSNHWMDLLLEGWGDENFGNLIEDMQDFFKRTYGYTNFDEELIHDRNGNTLPREPLREHFAAPWARLNDNNDIVFIPMIWLAEDVCVALTFSCLNPQSSAIIRLYKSSPLTLLRPQVTGQRFIDQGFELFYRLMTGGTLPERKLHPEPLPEDNTLQSKVCHSTRG